jgi:hypothetical protein
LLVWYAIRKHHSNRLLSSSNSDILDASIDAKVERTKYRPLPSKRISTTSAYLWFAVQLVTCSLLVYTSLGLHSFLVVLPAYALSAFYPLTKRFMQWPQLVLAPTVAWPVLVGWTSVRGPIALEAAAPLFACYAVWTIYYDTAYGFQVRTSSVYLSTIRSHSPAFIWKISIIYSRLSILLSHELTRLVRTSTTISTRKLGPFRSPLARRTLNPSCLCWAPSPSCS